MNCYWLKRNSYKQEHTHNLMIDGIIYVRMNLSIYLAIFSQLENRCHTYTQPLAKHRKDVGPVRTGEKHGFRGGNSIYFQPIVTFCDGENSFGSPSSDPFFPSLFFFF